ncbi:hypothetical protein BKA62DRAFT_675381 [Auriculariales sp. MPI-PUGE-AT-0066]|nr:hypothetical protein BKA62DRAFT_675381 [Auriculariales sp. MPI-PUGE-AT-0066]
MEFPFSPYGSWPPVNPDSTAAPKRKAQATSVIAGTRAPPSKRARNVGHPDGNEAEKQQVCAQQLPPPRASREHLSRAKKPTSLAEPVHNKAVAPANPKKRAVVSRAKRIMIVQDVDMVRDAVTAHPSSGPQRRTKGAPFRHKKQAEQAPLPTVAEEVQSQKAQPQEPNMRRFSPEPDYFSSLGPRFLQPPNAAARQLNESLPGETFASNPVAPRVAPTMLESKDFSSSEVDYITLQLAVLNIQREQRAMKKVLLKLTAEGHPNGCIGRRFFQIPSDDTQQRERHVVLESKRIRDDQCTMATISALLYNLDAKVVSVLYIRDENSGNTLRSAQNILNTTLVRTRYTRPYEPGVFPMRYKAHPLGLVFTSLIVPEICRVRRPCVPRLLRAGNTPDIRGRLDLDRFRLVIVMVQ